jgi:hypothetical protein
VGAKDQTVVLPQLPELEPLGVWAALWTLSASTACRVSRMLRPLPFFGVVIGRAGPRLGPGPPDPQDACFLVQVFPFETQEFATRSPAVTAST